MPLITIVLVLIVIGVLLWLMERYIPMDATIKRIIQGLVIIVVVIWILQVTGLWVMLSQVRVGGQ